MNRMLKTTLISTLLAGAILPTVMQAPALAGGSVSYTLAPSRDEGGDVLAAGMRLYSLYKGIKGGQIRQDGIGNAAGLSQAGQGNIGFIRQKGSDHSATLRQAGDDNVYGILQYGRGTRTDVEQNGYGRSGLTFSYGW